MFKIKREYKIYAYEITCNLNIIFFYMNRKYYFLVHLILCQLIYPHSSIDEVVWSLASEVSILSTWPYMMVVARQLTK